MKKLFGLIKLTITLMLVAAGGAILLALWYLKDLPNPELALAKGLAQSTKIYDRTGNALLYQIGQERRTLLPLDQLPAHVRWATLVAEDADFYKHPGIDIAGILRAAWNDVRNRSLAEGGSTITQQFVKNALLSPEKTFSRKFREIVLAVWLETTYSKDEILSFYLNQIPYGANAYGIEQASRNYFGISARDLDVAKAALLAALPARPSYLSPYGEHKEKLFARKDRIIERMVKEGYISQDQAVKEKQKRLSFQHGPSEVRGEFVAPHFIVMVKEYLEEKYGSEVVEKGGLEVVTTLDTRLQAQAQKAVFEIATKNEKAFRARNAALVALDPKTGQILAMVGSRDWFDDSIDGKVNVALRLRQPGSAFKPIVYAKLFEEGLGPESLIFDLKTAFKTRAGKHYTPINFDGKTRGLLTLRQALGQSINIAAVKVLYLVGIDEVIAFAKKMGIGSINPGRVDLALVLGGAEVRLLDLTAAYGTFAYDGVFNPPQFILRVKDTKGNMLEDFSKKPRKVVKPEIARLITSILSDNEARSPIFGASSPLYIPGIAAGVKTGTTTDFRDGWTIGYTPNLVVGVWAGNNDNTPTYKGEGAFVAGPIWNRLVRFAATTYPSEFGGSFPEPGPSNLLDKPMVNGSLVYERELIVDANTGSRATSLTPPPLREERTVKEIHSLLFYVRPNDPQLEAWEKPVQEWVKSQPNALAYEPSFLPLLNPVSPIPENESQRNGQKPNLSIVNLNDGQEVGLTLSLQFSFSGALPLKQVDVFLDELLVKTAISAPLEIDLSQFLEGDHLLRVNAYDQGLNFDTKEIYIILKK